MKPEKYLAKVLKPLQLSSWKFYPVVGSTNDIAIDMAKAGAFDWTLVIADQQNAGRGRDNRQWVTHAGAGLAFSLVLRPSPDERAVLTRFTALAALSLVRALSTLGLQAEIKWPNDVLLERAKVAGVLVEVNWQDDQLESLVIGMGVNINPDAVPPQSLTRYPATSVVQALGKPVDRWQILAETLRAMKKLRLILPYPNFIELWNKHLAFRGEMKFFRLPSGQISKFKILSITPEGKLRVSDTRNKQMEFVSGEIEIQGLDS